MTSLKCDDLVDAMGRITATAATPHLVSPTPRADLFGQAVRFSYFASCSADLDPTHCTLANLFYEAVGDESAAKVIVLASNGCTDTSMGRRSDGCHDPLRPSTRRRGRRSAARTETRRRAGRSR